MAEPFTVDHFEEWAASLVLDDGERWALEPFQAEFVEDVFRGFRECWLIVPEGNGKTTLLAGLGLYGLRFAEEPSIPIAASSMNQAKILYRQARGFIRRNRLETPKDDVWFEAYDGWKRVDLRRVNPRSKRGTILGSLEVYGADAGGGDGVIPFPFAFLDELHRQEMDLYQTWRGKLDKREAQLITISTAGAPGSDFEETREAIRVSGEVTRRGRTFLRVAGAELVLHEHAVPADGDVNDLGLVAEANPLRAVTVEKLARKKSAPTMRDPHWRRFTCNIATRTDREVFVPVEAWKACGPAESEEPFEIAEDSSVCVGADGSRTWDTTVLAWAAPGDRIDVDCTVFSVRKGIAYHVLHEGRKIDFVNVEESLFDLFERFDVDATAYDPRYLERSMEIADERLPEDAIIAVQPWSKPARDAYQALFTAIIDGTLRHRGDPVLTAHILNCAVERDENTKEIRKLKKLDPRKPIDAVPALAFAVWQAATRQPMSSEALVFSL